MKKYVLFLVLQCCLSARAQTKVLFSYDSAGNQFLRELCINCLPDSEDQTAITDDVIDQDLDKDGKEDVISYYPNPVKEELYLQWQLVENNYVTSIQVYSMAGQQLQTFRINEQTHDLRIPFRNYPAGIYLVKLSYKDGNHKAIKISKQ